MTKIIPQLAVLLSISAALSSAFQTRAFAATRRSYYLSPLRSATTDEEEVVVEKEVPTTDAAVEEVDCIVIGSGIGGLSCAGLLAATGRTVKVLEKHYEIGGCAHEFYMDLNG